ncbi:MAG: signal recognition particle-docking protein FtsY [Planctomycetota bacterium]|jgi:fused signal recognition particle receptor
MAPFNLFRRKRKADDEQPEPAEHPESTEERDQAGLFGKLSAGLQKTRLKVTGGLRGVLSIHRSLDEELLEEIEEQLYLADIGPRAVMRLCEGLREAYKEGKIEEPGQVLGFLKEHMKEDLRQWDTQLHLPREGTGVILVAGVNGSGKTTSIAKLAAAFVGEGKRVLLAASDTFRAAAVEQLEIWAGRVGADIVKNESADPAAVAFDAADKATANAYDVLIVDTAGRLHTRRNLMMELQKVSRVLDRKVAGAPHETLMVLDATTGQNAISQAIRFNESLELSGIVLAKLDGTAKGGIVFGMRDQIDIPVKFVGVGERAQDLAPFDADQFVDAMFE